MQPQFGFPGYGVLPQQPPGFGVLSQQPHSYGAPVIQQQTVPLAPAPQPLVHVFPPGQQSSGAGSSQSASGEVTAPGMPEQELDPRYSKLVCFNCGDPGHFVGNCVKPKL